MGMRRFFLLILGLFFLSNFVSWTAFNWILEHLGAWPVFRWGMGIFLLLQVIGTAAMIGARLLGHQPGTGMGRPLLALLMIWNMLLALPTGTMALVWAGVWWSWGGAMAHDPVWRNVGLSVVALPFVVAFGLAALAIWQLGRFRINRVTLTIPGLPAALRGLTIAHLSDLHVGKLTRGRVLEDMVVATNGLEPDLILLTGDLINMSLEDLPPALNLLRRMKARYGLFLCEGNHDLLESRARFEAEVKASGLPFLLNESVTISIRGQGVQILGLRWGEGMERETVGAVAQAALGRLLSRREPDDFTILLAHHPDVFDAAAQAGVPLTLAGHTHGGQLMLTHHIGLGPWFFRYWSGLYEQGRSRMMVSNGSGNWFPLRVNAPAEIVYLTLE